MRKHVIRVELRVCIFHAIVQPYHCCSLHLDPSQRCSKSSTKSVHAPEAATRRYIPTASATSCAIPWPFFNFTASWKRKEILRLQLQLLLLHFKQFQGDELRRRQHTPRSASQIRRMAYFCVFRPRDLVLELIGDVIALATSADENVSCSSTS